MVKTPDQIAAQIMGDANDGNDSILTAEDLRSALIAAIEADRAQRSPMERFGAFVYEVMDGEEWSSDTLQTIGDYAALVLNMPFSGPDDED